MKPSGRRQLERTRPRPVARTEGKRAWNRLLGPRLDTERPFWFSPVARTYCPLLHAPNFELFNVESMNRNWHRRISTKHLKLISNALSHCDMRLVQYTAGSENFGDSIQSLVGAYLLALLTCSEFQIVWPDLPMYFSSPPMYTTRSQGYLRYDNRPTVTWTGQSLNVFFNTTVRKVRVEKVSHNQFAALFAHSSFASGARAYGLDTLTWEAAFSLLAHTLLRPDLHLFSLVKSAGIDSHSKLIGVELGANVSLELIKKKYPSATIYEARKSNNFKENAVSWAILCSADVVYSVSAFGRTAAWYGKAIHSPNESISADLPIWNDSAESVSMIHDAPATLDSFRRNSDPQETRNTVIGFMSPVRNNEKHMRRSLEIAFKLLDGFDSKSRLFIYESDSSDETRALLDAETDARLIVIHGESQLSREPLRTNRIAIARRELWQTLQNTLPNVDFAVMADLDDRFGANILNTFDFFFRTGNKNWNVQFANQHIVYYDIWALELGYGTKGRDSWHQVWLAVKNGQEQKMAEQSFLDPYYHAIPNNLPTNGGLLRVESAFGGLGIYQPERAFACWRAIRGASLDGMEECEHSHFHKCIRDEKHGGIYINTNVYNDDEQA